MEVHHLRFTQHMWGERHYIEWSIRVDLVTKYIQLILQIGQHKEWHRRRNQHAGDPHTSAKHHSANQ